MFPYSRSTSTHRTHRRNEVIPKVEGLEDRLVLSSFNGGQWVYASRVTFSFAPDGTDVGGVASNLNSALNARGFSTQTWQNQFRRAAALWQAVANINFAEVSDNGASFSTSGNQQNDSRFGDIRIAGVPQDPNVLGLAFLPPPINGGTLAGDVVLNSSASWNVNNNYDLMTVALHEFGHALGLDHSNIQNAVMYAYYTGLKQSLNPDDQSGIRTLYTSRQLDVLDAARSNDIYTNATSLTSYIDSNLQVRLGGLDMTTSSDNDWFTVVAPSGVSSTMTVTVQSTDLSLLSPRLTVHSASLSVLGQASSTSYGATVSVTLNNVLPGQLFYFRVQTASGGGALSGNYGLLVNMGNQAIDPIAPPNTTVTEQPNRGGGSSNMSTEERIRLGEIEGFGDDLLVSEMSSTAASTDLKPALWAEVPWIVFAMADWLGEGDAPTVPSRDRFSQLKLFDRALASLQVRKG